VKKRKQRQPQSPAALDVNSINNLPNKLMLAKFKSLLLKMIRTHRRSGYAQIENDIKISCLAAAQNKSYGIAD
jgi:hypothetical protein